MPTSICITTSTSPRRKRSPPKSAKDAPARRQLRGVLPARLLALQRQDDGGELGGATRRRGAQAERHEGGQARDGAGLPAPAHVLLLDRRRGGRGDHPYPERRRRRFLQPTRRTLPRPLQPAHAERGRGRCRRARARDGGGPARLYHLGPHRLPRAGRTPVRGVLGGGGAARRAGVHPSRFRGLEGAVPLLHGELRRQPAVHHGRRHEAHPVGPFRALPGSPAIARPRGRETSPGR